MTGRELPPSSPFAGDDGSADPGVAAALADLGAGGGTVAGVVAALAGTRVLVPVLAELDSAGTVEVGGHAHTVEKEASAGIVALRAPDGRTALPVFSSVASMTAWRRDARPVPTEVARAALSAVQEGWELLVVDPGGPVTALLPRPAVWALAQQQPWRPAVTGAGADAAVDPEVAGAVRAAVLAAVGTAGSGPADATGRDAAGTTGSGAVDQTGRDAAGTTGSGAADATGRDAARRVRGWWRRRPAPGPTGPLLEVAALPGSRAELAVELRLVPGLDRAAVDAVVRRVGEALGADETVTQRVDSVEVRLR